MNIYCCVCENEISAKLITGQTAYSHRSDLKDKRFWQCPGCFSFVGTHKYDKKHTPLGVIVSKEVKQFRIKIHAIIDPIWKSKKLSRKEVYTKMTHLLEVKEYHTANIKSVEEGSEALKAAYNIRGELS
jgi:hypothetical protein